MDADHNDAPLLASPFFRGIIAIACLGVFFIVASVIDPDPSEAGQNAPVIGLGASQANPNRTDSTPVGRTAFLGTLLGLKYTIEMYGTDQGVLYTVFDENGDKVINLATPAEVRQAIPDLDIEALKAQQVGEADNDDPIGGF